jgi:hypothetical protein
MMIDFEPSQPKAFCAEKLIEWISQSQNPDNWADITPLTLPPLQRNGVWRPRQVLDLWGSVLDGLPIGLFYVQAIKAGCNVVDPRDRTSLTEIRAPAWELFDGQQRMRALALGDGDPFAEGRCLWVKFAADAYELLISSRAQPAGYQRDGTKHPVDVRRKWLKKQSEVEAGVETGAIAYSDKDVGKWWEKAPYPVGCSAIDTWKLADLRRSADGALVPSDRGFMAWQHAINNLRQAPCAVFMRLPCSVGGGSLDHGITKSLEMFRRIGAGGTPLSQDEQVYAAYKLRKPELRHVVERIHQSVSAILTPAQIIQAGIRIAHTQADLTTGWVPGFDQIIRELSDGGGTSKICWTEKLDDLLRPQEGRAKLEQLFEDVRGLLQKKDNESDFFLPDIVMAQLRPEAWHVLAFWAMQEGPARLTSRKEAVRFALFWHLAVTNDEKAAQVCFRELQGSGTETLDGWLYRRITIAGCGLQVPRPDDLTDFFLKAKGAPGWLKYYVRFQDAVPHSEFARRWWFGGKTMLPWLQRHYIGELFTSFSPLFDFEDDLPYDLDHICARKHWEFGWNNSDQYYVDRGFSSKIDWRDGWGEPAMVGDAIGNLRLVKFNQNREDGANGIREKMPFLDLGSSFEYDRERFGEAKDFLMHQEHAGRWLAADIPKDAGAQHTWTLERRAAFQNAVEHRTESLYRTFFDGLGFVAWCDSPVT